MCNQRRGVRRRRGGAAHAVHSSSDLRVGLCGPRHISVERTREVRRCYPEGALYRIRKSSGWGGFENLYTAQNRRVIGPATCRVLASKLSFLRVEASTEHPAGLETAQTLL